MNAVHNTEQAPGWEYPVPSVHQAFRLLEIISENPSGLGVSELATRNGWPKSSIHNILVTLAHDGFVAQDPESGRYRMTVKLGKWSNVVDQASQVAILKASSSSNNSFRLGSGVTCFPSLNSTPARTNGTR